MQVIFALDPTTVLFTNVSSPFLLVTGSWRISKKLIINFIKHSTKSNIMCRDEDFLLRTNCPPKRVEKIIERFLAHMEKEISLR